MKTVFEETETRAPTRSATNGRARAKPKPKAPPRPKASLLTRWTQRVAYFYAFRDYATNYLAAFVADRAELIRVRSREAVQFATSRLICGALLLAVAVTAVVMTLRGISGGLAEAFSGRAWAGDLATAGGLALIGLGVWLYMRRSANADHPDARVRPRRRR